MLLSLRLKLLFDELELGPAGIPGGVGEARTFSAQVVQSPFFVIMWLKWLPDYILGHTTTHKWWKDSDVPFSKPKRTHVAGVVDQDQGGVRPTTVLCDWAATAGAELYDRAWLTERGLEGALLVHTRRIVKDHEDFTLPGWESVEKALAFLKAGAKGTREGPMRAFLAAIGYT